MMRVPLVMISAVGLASCSMAPPAPQISINELMVSRVTPSTDALWGVENPQTLEEWAVLDAAADDVIAAFEQVKLGGVGPNDNAWASETTWQAYADEVIAAGKQAKSAIASRSVDDLIEAGFFLYPPCENCHLDYHPGVQAAQ
jgi:hypothetical protein